MILVVIADPAYRELVGDALDVLEVAHQDLATWRNVVAVVETRPALVIVDLDDVSERLPGLFALLRSGWGEPIPFVALSRRPNIAEVAGELAAIGSVRLG